MPSPTRAEKIQNLAMLYGWQFVDKFGDEQPDRNGKPIALLVRGTGPAKEYAELKYSMRLSTWVKVLARPPGQQESVFIPDLWANSMADMMARAVDKSVLASLAKGAVNSRGHAPDTVRIQKFPTYR